MSVRELKRERAGIYPSPKRVMDAFAVAVILRLMSWGSLMRAGLQSMCFVGALEQVIAGRSA